MEIIPDPIHALLLVIPFAVTSLFLNVVLWKPLLAWMDERTATSDHARHEAHELDHAATEATRKVEERLTSARNHVSTLRAAARGRAQGKEAEIVAAARHQADERVSGALAEIVTEQKAASSALAGSAGELSNQIAGRILGRSVERTA